MKSGGQAVLGRQHVSPTPWLTERHGYDPTSRNGGERTKSASKETLDMRCAHPHFLCAQHEEIHQNGPLASILHFLQLLLNSSNLGNQNQEENQC